MWNKEQTFANKSIGFCKWHRAKEAFAEHSKAANHRICTESWQKKDQPNIMQQLETKLLLNFQKCNKGFLKSLPALYFSFVKVCQ